MKINQKNNPLTNALHHLSTYNCIYTGWPPECLVPEGMYINRLIFLLDLLKIYNPKRMQPDLSQAGWWGESSSLR